MFVEYFMFMELEIMVLAYNLPRIILSFRKAAIIIYSNGLAIPQTYNGSGVKQSFVVYRKRFTTLKSLSYQYNGV